MCENENLSLAELTGVDWGDTPKDVSTSVRERFEFRRTPLQQLSIEGIERLLAIDFQDDREHLIPLGIQRCDAAIVSTDESLLKHIRLLITAVSNGSFDWLGQPDMIHRIRELADKFDQALIESSDAAEQSEDSIGYYKILIRNSDLKASLFQSLAALEKRISSIPPI